MVRRPAGSRRRFEEYIRRRRDARWAVMDHVEAAGGRAPPKGAGKRLRHRSFAALFRAFWGLLRGHRATILAALGTLSVATVLSLLIPSSTKIVIDYILTDHPGPAALPDWAWIPRGDSVAVRVRLLWLVGLAMVGITLVSVSVGTWGRWQITRLSKRLSARLRRVTFEHAVELPLFRVQEHKSGGLTSLLREDAGGASELLFSLIYNPWRAIVQLTGTLAVLAVVNWRMLAGAVLLLPVVWITHRAWISRIRPVYRDIRITRQGIDAHTTEAFGGIRVVRGFGRHRTESSRFVRASHYMARQELLVWWWSRVVEIAWSVLVPVASVALLVYGGSAVIRGTLTIGDVMMFSTYLLTLLSPLEALTNSATNVQTHLAGLDRVLDLLGEEREFEGSRASGAGATRANTRGRVTLRSAK